MSRPSVVSVMLVHIPYIYLNVSAILIAQKLRHFVLKFREEIRSGSMDYVI